MTVELCDYAARYFAENAGGNHYVEAFPGLFLISRELMTPPELMMYEPSLCVVLRGAKRVALGEMSLTYSALQAVVVSAELPLVGHVVEASPEAPYLGLTVVFDIPLLIDVVNALPRRFEADAESRLGLLRQSFDARLADCLLRLMRLSETPEALPVLRPAILKELYYWLLAGENGGEIVKLAVPDSHTRRIANAIAMLRARFDQSLKIEELAEAARMSLSSFHQHFKALTSMSPLQFQKSLRLIEARRLMLAGEANATSAAFQVGYESATQFSREYARMFGQPPRRDTVGQRALRAG